MNIVFDTNVIFGDWYLNGPNMVLIETFIKSQKLKLFIPEIVIQETKNRYRKEMEGLLLTWNKILILKPNLRKTFHVLKLDNLCKEYDIELEKRLLELNIIRPNYNDIAHSHIVTRSLLNKKPFRESDKGYRDTLLWETLLKHIACENDTTFFVTNNIKDFADEKDNKSLHKNLKEDLIINNLPDNCIILFHDKKSLINDIITPYLQKIAIEELKKGKFEQFDFSKWFEDNHEEFIAHLNEDIESIFEGEFENPELVFIEEPDEFTVEKAYELDEGKVYLDVALKATLSIDVFIPKYDDIPKGYSLIIWDSDWNKHYMFASFSIKLPIHLSIIFDIFKQEVEDFEINTIGEVYGFCKNCGEPILSDSAENCSNCGKSLIDN